MIPREIVILLSLALPNTFGLTLFKCPINEMDEYIDSLYDSLVQRGYLIKDNLNIYTLTLKGEESFIQFLEENKTRADSIISALQQLRIENNRKIEELYERLLEQVSEKHVGNLLK